VEVSGGVIKGGLEMGGFSEHQKKLMRVAQFDRCARCHKILAEDDEEGHAIFRSHVYWLNGELLCKDCHKKTRSYGRPIRKLGDPLFPLID